MRYVASCVSVIVGAMFAAVSVHAQPTPLSTAINYQGQLKQGGNLVSATADFQFTLFDALAGPTQIGAMVSVNNVAVSDGIFTVPLDFGANAFDGNDRYLQIAVRSPAGSGSFTTLAPRQPIAAAPYALQTRGIFVNSGNNVGIGTTAPSGPMHVARDVDPIMILQDTGPASTQAGYVTFWNNTPTETGWVGFGTPGSPTLSVTNIRAGGNVRFLTQGVERMTVTSFGNVGIGTTTPSRPLTVNGGIAVDGGDMRINALPDGYYLDYSFGRLVVNLSNPPFAAPLMEFKVNEVIQGNITVQGATVSYNGFMGSHYGWMNGGQSIDRGALVRMTGENRRLNDRAEGDVVYGIEPTTNANDPACLGAYLGIMESGKPADTDNPHLVAAVGNGDMWVVESGRSIQPGDYLISSDVEGHAMLDDPQRFPVGYVIARAAEAGGWAGVTDTVAGRRRQRISVFFESFERASAADAEIASLRAEVADLKALVRRLTSSRKGGPGQ